MFAVNVVDEHLGACLGELVGMLDPGLARLGIGGLLPPAVFFDDVDAAVATDVAPPRPYVNRW